MGIFDIILEGWANLRLFWNSWAFLIFPPWEITFAAIICLFLEEITISAKNRHFPLNKRISANIVEISAKPPGFLLEQACFRWNTSFSEKQTIVRGKATFLRKTAIFYLSEKARMPLFGKIIAGMPTPFFNCWNAPTQKIIAGMPPIFKISGTQSTHHWRYPERQTIIIENTTRHA